MERQPSSNGDSSSELQRISGLARKSGSGLRLFVLTARDIEDDDAFRHGDLDRREADARRVVHRLEHIVHQSEDVFIDGRDGLGSSAAAGGRAK